jgi:predicted ATP-grasp superfamily ATP-dependent carboligase
VAAVFVAADGNAAILGVTRQLLGGDSRAAIESVDMHAETGASARGLTEPQVCDDSPFRYAGSIGPLVLSDDRFRTVERIGKVLAGACGLTGLFGVDAVVNAKSVWPVEINPRYTASVEVLERASSLRTLGRRPRRLSAIEWHEAACLRRQLPAPLGQSDEITSGKLIYYAPRDIIFSTPAARFAVEQNLAHVQPAVADIPAAGAAIRHGHPVLTFLAEGPTAANVRDQLRTAVESLHTVLSTGA